MRRLFKSNIPRLVHATLAVHFTLFGVFLQAHWAWHLTHDAIENASLAAAAEVHCEDAIRSAGEDDGEDHGCHHCLICAICNTVFDRGLNDRGLCITESRKSILPDDSVSKFTRLSPFFYLRAPPAA